MLLTKRIDNFDRLPNVTLFSEMGFRERFGAKMSLIDICKAPTAREFAGALTRCLAMRLLAGQAGSR